MTRNATLSNFTLYAIENSLSGGETMTITLRKNGSDTAISKTFTQSDADSQVYTMSGTVEYAAGDTFSLPVVASTSASGAVYVGGAFDLTYE
jgi:hypothetical protein